MRFESADLRSKEARSCLFCGGRTSQERPSIVEGRASDWKFAAARCCKILLVRLACVTISTRSSGCSVCASLVCFSKKFHGGGGGGGGESASLAPQAGPADWPAEHLIGRLLRGRGGRSSRERERESTRPRSWTPASAQDQTSGRSGLLCLPAAGCWLLKLQAVEAASCPVCGWRLLLLAPQQAQFIASNVSSSSSSHWPERLLWRPKSVLLAPIAR